MSRMRLFLDYIFAVQQIVPRITMSTTFCESVLLGKEEMSGQRESNPFSPFRESAPFCRKFAAISALTAFVQNEHIADSRRITQFECPNLSENPRARV